MPNSVEMEMKIRAMLLEMGDEELLAELEEALKVLNERNRRMSETLDQLLQEVDGLLLRMDELESQEEIVERKADEICIR